MAIQSGLLVSELIKKENKIIVSRELKKYKEKDLEKYIEKFDQFKKNKIIDNESFNDNLWRLVRFDENGHMHIRNIYFSWEINQGINNKLKAYTISLLTNMLGINEIAYDNKIINEIIHISNFFNKDLYCDFEEYFLSLEDTSAVRCRDTLFKFISFIDDNIESEYYNFLEVFSCEVKNNPREIPDYTSILKFDYIVNKYINEASALEFFKYFAALLWWKISSKIPIRPGEFLILKNADFYEEDNKYYVIVTRIKPHNFIARALKERKKQVFRINKEIYDLVKKVKDHELNDSEYLLSKRLYAQFISDYKYGDDKIQGKVMNYKNLANNLHDFYMDVVKKTHGLKLINKNQKNFISDMSNTERYQEYIVCLQLGDARHLAIINLLLQGTNNYLIKEMAGHRDINSHMHYIDHAKSYISSKILVLTDIRKMELKMLDRESTLINKLGNRRYDKIQSYSSNQYIKVGNYFCKTYLNREYLFPSLCLTDCDECNGGIRDIKSCTMEEIDNKILYNNNEIEGQLKVIEKYIIDADIKTILNKKREKYFSDSQKNIEESANRLEHLISVEADLEAYKYQKSIISEEKEK